MTARATRTPAPAAKQNAGNDTPPDSANLDVDGGTKDEDQPTESKMPRARHELVTGPDVDDKVAAGTLITDEVAQLYDLDDKTIARLVASGAIELVDVIKA